MRRARILLAFTILATAALPAYAQPQGAPSASAPAAPASASAPAASASAPTPAASASAPAPAASASAPAPAASGAASAAPPKRGPRNEPCDAAVTAWASRASKRAGLTITPVSCVKGVIRLGVGGAGCDFEVAADKGFRRTSDGRLWVSPIADLDWDTAPAPMKHALDALAGVLAEEPGLKLPDGTVERGEHGGGGLPVVPIAAGIGVVVAAAAVAGWMRMRRARAKAGAGPAGAAGG